MRSGTVRILVALAVTTALSGCGGVSLTGKSKDAPQATPVSLERQNTAENRLIQVSSTAARASYCAFGMDRAKLKANYLAYERQQGASEEVVGKFDRLYDSSYNLFYNKVRENPDSCSKDQIEEIRPDINRHLAGDYTPSKRKPKVEQADVKAPTLNQDKIDITSGGIDNDVFKDPTSRY
jgi:hypothetical protein